MALIEGVGDEVTLLLAALLVLAVLVLAWTSTRTFDPGEGGAQEEQPGPAPSAATASDSSTEAPPPEEAGEEGVRRRGGNSLVLRLKFINDTERTTTVRPTETVGDIKRWVLPGEESRVRLIFQGQLLQDDSASVASVGLSDGCVLHCHVSASAPAPPASAAEGPGSRGGPLNPGALLVPLLLLLLLLLWLCQLHFSELFSFTASASLLGLTLVLSVVAYGVYRR